MEVDYVDSGRVSYTFRYYPFLGDESYYAAEASECAADQGKFWEYHDLLFQRWQGEGVGTFLPDKLKVYAGELGLDQTAFDSCLDSRRYEATVLADKQEGRQRGVRYTPSLYLNGELIPSPREYADLKALIEDALAGR